MELGYDIPKCGNLGLSYRMLSCYHVIIAEKGMRFRTRPGAAQLSSAQLSSAQLCNARYVILQLTQY